MWKFVIRKNKKYFIPYLLDDKNTVILHGELHRTKEEALQDIGEIKGVTGN